MQALSIEQYVRLQQLARCYQHRYAATIKRHPKRNPYLTVDLLCCQPLPAEAGGNEGELVGALVTPMALSLVVVASAPRALSDSMPTRWITLPGGEYPFKARSLGDDDGLWQCELLDDLADIESLHDASRLAQYMIDQVLTPVAG